MIKEADVATKYAGIVASDRGSAFFRHFTGKKDFQKVHVDDADATHILADMIKINMPYSGNHRNLMFVCIGTTEVSGDSVGPRVGSLLNDIVESEPLYKNRISVFGTADEPLDYSNCGYLIPHYRRTAKEKGSIVVAIDSGIVQNPKDKNMIYISSNPLIPGAGVHVTLPKIGHVQLVAGTAAVGDDFNGVSKWSISRITDVISHALISVMEDCSF